ncbi:hypothetical protein GOP47_0013685 [Adiantum capillus-veneris]|uniref:TF-B3 domain-containing protein n=1 Tax=Adiantum capillus-veneris TaxID=13818 RepID=A0A9D4UP01_ADICA|nr:hypothetical protein GOP47_0013685 [Adiantum capillus-veneris]
MKVTSMGFKTGWRKFAADHQLAQGDVLVLKLMSKSHFKVKTFGKHGLLKDLVLKKEKEGKRKHINENEADHLQCPAKRHKGYNADSNLCKNRETTEAKQEWNFGKSIVSCSKGDTPAEMDSLETVIDEFMVLDEEPRYAARNFFPFTLLEKAEVSQVPKDNTPMDLSTIISQRRPVSQAEKERALNAAKRFKTSLPAFRKIMKKSNVYRGFWLGISRGFAAEHLPCETQQVILTNSSRKQWITKLLGSRSNPGLSGGWKKFAVDNYLEEGDVCVFELTDKTSLHLTVHIYRVVELDKMQMQDKTRLAKKCHLIGAGKMRGAISGDGMKSNIIARTNSLPTVHHDHQLFPEQKPTENGELCGIEVEICQHLKSMLLQKQVKEEETIQPELGPCIVKAEPLDLLEMGLCTDKINEMQNHPPEKIHEDLSRKAKHEARRQTAASNVKMRGRIVVETECLDNTQAKKCPLDVNGCIQTQLNAASTREPKTFCYYDVERLINRRKGKSEDEFLVQLSAKAKSGTQTSICSREQGSWWVPMSFFKPGFDSCHL